MFSKAKLVRFNEEVGCAPPPTAYNPKEKNGSSQAVTLDKSKRWRQTTEMTPGPGAYNTDMIPPASPMKRPNSASSTCSASRINSSILSNGSNTSSHSIGLAVPKSHHSHATSPKAVRGLKELQERITQLTKERDQMKEVIKQLESQTGDDEVFELPGPRRDNHSTPPNSPTKQGLDGLTKQLNETKEELSEAQQLISSLTDERSGLQLKLKEIQESSEKDSLNEETERGLKEEINHLTQLRDNLEKSVLFKEDLIAELQLQLDEVVSDATSLQRKLDETIQEKSEVEGQVKELVTHYEILIAQQRHIQSQQEEEMIKKDIEIQLLNTSITNLNTKINECETTISTLEEEASRVSILEATVSELSLAAKERELTDSMHQEELNTNYQEVTNLQQKIEELEIKLAELKSEKKELAVKLEETKECKEQLEAALNEERERAKGLEMEVKEKEVVIQFMEKEVEAREVEITSLLEEVKSVQNSLQCHKDTEKELVDSNRQLEERIIELMAEISDREAEHISRMNRVESELDELGVKYSEALLNQECTRRALTHTSEELEKERLVRGGAEREVEDIKQQQQTLESNLKDLVQKYTSIEDALACEEAENRDLEERLERELGEAESAATEMRREMDTLITSNSGFCTQITQLKIDMRKKSDAVNEMQQCIELLRDEKQHFSTLCNNLQTTLDNRDQTLADLRRKLSTREVETEEKMAALGSRLADIENHLKESQEEVDAKVDVIRVLEAKVTELEEEGIKQSKMYEQRLDDKTQTVSQLTTKLHDITKAYDSYKDQLTNLETALSDKTSEFEEYKEMSANLESTSNRLKEQVDQTNQSLLDKTMALESTNATLSDLQEEVASLNKNLEEKVKALMIEQQKVRELEGQKDEVVKLKQDLSEVQKLKSSEKKQQDEISSEIDRLTKIWENEKAELLSKNSSISEELEVWKNKFTNLDRMIEPFREQLDAYEVEKMSLLERSSAAKEEVDKLSKQYTKLLGHQNHKQKIHHVLQLKSDNGKLKEEVHKLRQENERQRKSMRRLEDKMTLLGGSTSKLQNSSFRSLGSDKENSFLSASTSSLANLPFDCPPPSSTPLRSSNRPQRI